MKSGIDLLIFGSCVSRDVLNFDEGNTISLNGYFARSSMASAFYFKPLADRYSDQLTSPFQRKIVSADLSKGFVRHLSSASFDILLVDFIDERFRLWVSNLDEGVGCTLSGELLQTDFMERSGGGRTIASGTEAFYQLWEQGWSNFLQLLDARGLRNRLRIIKTYWATDIVNGDESSKRVSRLSIDFWLKRLNLRSAFWPNYSLRDIDSANAFLERLYRRVACDITAAQIISPPSDLIVGSEQHRWGKSPFHYADSFYEHVLNALREHGLEEQDFCALSDDNHVKCQK